MYERYTILRFHSTVAHGANEVTWLDVVAKRCSQVLLNGIHCRGLVWAGSAWVCVSPLRGPFLCALSRWWLWPLLLLISLYTLVRAPSGLLTIFLSLAPTALGLAVLFLVSGVCLWWRLGLSRLALPGLSMYGASSGGHGIGNIICGRYKTQP